MVHSGNGVSFCALSIQVSSHEKRHGRILDAHSLSKRNQSKKATYFIVLTLWPSGNGKTGDNKRKHFPEMKGWIRRR